MGKMPDALRETIARNIRDCRVRKFPGRGGGKRCAEAFGVSPQQWSPWESGKRTPDELRLDQIASFFDTNVEWFRRDHRSDAVIASYGDGQEVIRTHTFNGDAVSGRLGAALPDSINEEDINHYLWVVDLLTRRLTASGIKVVVTFEATAASAALTSAAAALTGAGA